VHKRYNIESRFPNHGFVYQLYLHPNYIVILITEIVWCFAHEWS